LNGDTKVAEWLRNGAEEFQCMAQVNEEEGKHCESKKHRLDGLRKKTHDMTTDP
jgi:hypothetical protein